MAAAPQAVAQGNGNQAQGGDANSGDMLQEWRQFAQMGQELAKKYPEATEGMVKILREIQQIMTRVAASPQRTPPNPAPPNP